MSKFKLPTDQVFVIAEIANTHGGSIIKLNNLVKKTLATGTDAIKFQFFKASELLVAKHPEYKLYENLEIPDSEWKKLFQLIRKTNVKIFVDVFSIERAKFANKLGVDAFKIHSSDINNMELLEFVANTNKPILLSCSGCTLNEIDCAINMIKNENKIQIILMHGFQGFPTRMSEIHMKRITSLKQRYDLSVGYMDHISGDSILALYLPLVALGMGSTVIEKHITLNRSLKEEDYQSSLNPDEFQKMVKLLKDSYHSLGTESFSISNEESLYRKNMKKYPVAKRLLKKNIRIKKTDIVLKRISKDIPYISGDRIIEQFTKKQIKNDEALSEKNVELKKIKTVAAIACRVESTRLYAKPMQLITTKSILEHIILQLKQSKLIDEIVLAISENPGNEIFVKFAHENDLKFIRGDDEDVLKRIILAAEHVNANLVFRVTSEDPFKHWESIDLAIKQHMQSGADFTYTKDLPEGSGFELINLRALKTSHEKGKKRNRSEFVTSYIYEHQSDFKIKQFVVKPNLRRPKIRLTVDYPEDLILVRKIMSKIPHYVSLPRLENIIKLIDKNPELKNINSKYVEHDDRIWL